jgi:hypothetical protein
VAMKLGIEDHSSSRANVTTITRYRDPAGCLTALITRSSFPKNQNVMNVTLLWGFSPTVLCQNAHRSHGNFLPDSIPPPHQTAQPFCSQELTYPRQNSHPPPGNGTSRAHLPCRLNYKTYRLDRRQGSGEHRKCARGGST